MLTLLIVKDTQILSEILYAR